MRVKNERTWQYHEPEVAAQAESWTTLVPSRLRTTGVAASTRSLPKRERRDSPSRVLQAPDWVLQWGNKSRS